MSDTNMQRLPTFFLSHGGGPWPYMNGPMREHHAWLEQALAAVPAQLPRAPRAVLVISGHWEEPEFTLSSAAAPGMIYDYYGFPPETYRIRYPAPGDPLLAARLAERLSTDHRPVRLDSQRGFDHGTFAMLTPIYPKADVPVVQLSLKAGLDPAEHYAMGEALAFLRDEEVLILGGGQSYHNLRAWGPAGAEAAAAFDGWLRQTLSLTPEARRDALIAWEQAPAARQAHPREEHLIPLMVAAGAAAGDPATAIYGEKFMGQLASSSFRFGADRTPSGFDRLANL